MDNRPLLSGKKIYTQKCNWPVDRFIVFIAFCFNNSASTVDNIFQFHCLDTNE